jgi:hypothetical protein
MNEAKEPLPFRSNIFNDYQAGMLFSVFTNLTRRLDFTTLFSLNKAISKMQIEEKLKKFIVQKIKDLIFIQQ